MSKVRVEFPNATRDEILRILRTRHEEAEMDLEDAERRRRTAKNPKAAFILVVPRVRCPLYDLTEHCELKFRRPQTPISL